MSNLMLRGAAALILAGLPAFVGAQSLAVESSRAVAGTRDVPVRIAYTPGAGIEAFEFGLEFPFNLSTNDAKVSMAIGAGAGQCRVATPTELRCVVLSSQQGTDIASGTITVAFDTTPVSGTAGLFLTRVEFVDGQGEVKPGGIDNGTLVLSTPPSLSVQDVVVDEGTGGSTDVTFALSLSAPAPAGGVSARVSTRDDTARAGFDYEALNRQVTFAEGAVSTSVVVRAIADSDVEPDERFVLVVDTPNGLSIADGEATATLRNDDAPPPPTIHARPDRFVLEENAGATALAVLGNDIVDAGRLVGGTLGLVGAPSAGSVVVDAGARSDSAADDRLVFSPPVDWSGFSTFRYRLCELGGRCIEAPVQVVVTPIDPAASQRIEVEGARGAIDLPLDGLRALDDARYAATPAVVADVTSAVLAPDPTPNDPWDFSGIALARGVLSHPGGDAVEWRVLVDLRTNGGDGDLYVGVDANGDGLPQQDEMRCASAMSLQSERCELVVTTSPQQAQVNYWAFTHNRGAATANVMIERFPVALATAANAATATGPARLPKGRAHELRLAWDQPDLHAGSSAVSYVQLRNGTQAGAWSPVRLDRRAQTPSAPLALSHNVLREVSLPADGWVDRVFIDVPAGIQTLTVTASSDANVDLYLTHLRAPVAGEAAIAASPAANTALAQSTGSASREVATVSNPAPGRWYALVRNGTTQPRRVGISAQLVGNGARLRSGSYFNPARTGHGLFVYPAGDQWAGLWYTYLKDGSPTWYYLQGPAPGTTGQWTGGLFRSAWHGSTNVLTPVGEATIAPSGPSDFRFSYNLDGQTGSETLSAFGRGCPSVAGSTVDASAHWFDPRRAGSGYSVQMFPNYEFYSVFVYDEFGIARFLTAELPRTGAARETMPLQQVQGFCPLCARTEPQRQSVGSLERSIAGAALQSITVNATYRAPLGGSWTAVDAVQPLGDRQGCQP